MLERVPASAESAATLLIRSFERPHRSTRVLDPKFWRNGADELDTASWWPAYLQKVRQIPHEGYQTPRDRTIAPLSVSHTASRGCHESVVNPKTQRYPTSGSARPYTVSASQRQAQNAKRLYDVFDLTEDLESEEARTSTAPNSPDNQEQSSQTWRSLVDTDDFTGNGEVDDSADGDASAWHKRRDQLRGANQELDGQHDLHTDANGWNLYSGLASLVPPDGIDPTRATAVLDSALPQIESRESREEQVVTKAPRNEKHQRLFDVIQAKDKASETQFEEAWRLFALLDDREAVAPAVFRFLQRTKHTKQLGRAVEAFKLIPKDRRGESMYKAAVDVELRRYQHRSAINFAFEADARGFNLLPTLLNHFVGNLLWNSAAELIRRRLTAGLPTPEPAFFGRQDDYKHLISACGTMSDLFFKVTSLAERLNSQDATLTQNRVLLTRLCRDLVVECARSTAVVGHITREGVLALLELGRTFGHDRLHQTILATIFRHPHRAERVDIALFVYRNYRLVMPDDRVSPRMLGGLISICGDAMVERHIYSYLLREFGLHCTDQETIPAYQRVLTLCARQGQVDAVEQFLQAYISTYGKPRSLAMLSPLIHVQAVSGDHANARKQFDRLKDEFGLKPNQICWNMLLLAHARSDDDSSAFEIFEEMLASGVDPDSYTYGTLLSICASHADTDAAVELLAEARDFGIPITVPMVGSVVEACLSNDDERQALGFVHAATTSGTQESLTWLWNILLKYYSFKGDTNAMLQVRKRMADFAIKADDMTYAALIGDLVSRRRTIEAIQMLREMHFQEGLPVTLFHYSIILQGLVMEGNRDMSIVIYNEIKLRFPRLSASADVALLSLQSQRDSLSSSNGRNSHSLNFLSTLLAEASRQTESLAALGRTIRSKTPKAVWFQIFENLLTSLIRNGSYDQAEMLLENLESSNWSEGKPKESDGITGNLLLVRMDLAVARQRWDAVGDIWQSLFKDAKRKHQPVKLPTPRVQALASDPESLDAEAQNLIDGNMEGATKKSHNEPSQPVQRSWRFSLSGPLNRYMSSMAQRGQLDDLWRFMREEFQPAGFQLSGRNWNKYIQLLCNSEDFRHKIAAFKWMEKMFINRAQSWKLVTRGLLRQKQTRHVLEASCKDKRPVLQKHNSYNVTKRERLMRLQPERKIPTYLTFVYLADVLQQAAERARSGKHGLMQQIGSVADKTKRFLQQMPYLKDRFQGTLLRKLPARPDDKARPRSELFFRKSTVSGGILGSRSPLDNLPAELLHDIEALIAPRDDIRQLLRRDRAVTLSPQQQHEVGVGEQVIGQIDRGAIVLAAKGRIEESHEKQRRIAFEERQRLQTVAYIRRDLRTRRLYEDPYRGRPTISIPPALPETDVSSSDSSLEASSTILAQLRNAGTDIDKQRTSSPASDQARDTSDKPAVQPGLGLPTGSIEKLSVSQQLERLETYRKSIAERSQSQSSVPSKPRLKGLAIPYANVRRIRRILANRQRNRNRLNLHRAGEQHFSTRTWDRLWKSSRTFQLLEMARERKALVLQQEQDLRAGKRLQPMPKTQQTVRGSRNLNFPSIRFVPDLGRKKWRYPVRRGLRRDLRLSESKRGDWDTFVPAEEMIKRRHPVLTKIKEMEEARGLTPDIRRRRRRRRPRAIQLGLPSPVVESNFKPITSSAEVRDYNSP
ncbi:hypothetical protein H2198_002899 [Neophaeococcomyces mojaviensis]|uniref:Uncharacterized protein n=1 Tax=Neophaeococcomyces mojaviensis TaxID=3383035 RepID=A0ACC3ADC1_9EURO|nr:hypothetical protein H2198_002899 [Knufia sp. JES_112]